MNFCCGVTLYYPSKEELSSILEYREIFDTVYVFDNTDSDERIINESYYYDKDNIQYISNYKNEGLSLGFNVMSHKAIAESYQYICLFDQDSLFTSENIIKMINYIKKDYSKEVAVYVPEVIYNYENKLNKNIKSECTGIEIEWAISSGSFINLSIYEKTDGFDENYFIDRLDYDYCISVRQLGYKVVKIKNTFLYQKLGEQRKGIFKGVSQHNPLRHYYIFRNRLYFYKKNDKPSIFKGIKIGLLSFKHFMIIILLEKQKNEKFKMIIRGIRDFIGNRMGKYQQL